MQREKNAKTYRTIGVLHVTDATYLEDYKIKIIFNNGRIGIADLKDSLDGLIFEPLKNISVFSQLNVDKELETIT